MSEGSTTESLEHQPDEVPEWGERRVLPEKLSSLRQKLYQKAKREPKFRFYSVYGLVLRQDVLMAAWEQVRRNRGAAGVDGVTIQQIVDSEEGPERFVEQIREELKTHSYKPSAVRRVYIPKPDGQERPLGIPTVKDRVVQTAVVLALEPIFEADFRDVSYGFRPGRSAHQALAKIRDHLREGFEEVYDADLKGYFDTIPHEKLIMALQVRVADRSVLKLIRMWLKAPVVDERQGGPPRRSRKGTPQGGVISPLLSNVYLHWFDTFFLRSDGPAGWANARLVRYADDFVVLARYQTRRLVQWIERTLETRMGLVVNRQKSRVIDLKRKGTSLDFLGFTYRYDADRFGRARRYLNVGPSKRAVGRERERLRAMTGTRQCFKPIPVLIRELNRHLKGWANYFSFGYPRAVFRAVNHLVRSRLYRHLWRRSQRPYQPPRGVSFYRQLQTLGLVSL